MFNIYIYNLEFLVKLAIMINTIAMIKELNLLIDFILI